MNGSDGPRRRGHWGLGLCLMAIGVLFLIMNLQPNFDPWPFLYRYWPFLFIFLGVLQLWEHLRTRQDGQASRTGLISGTAICVVVILLIVGLAVHGSRVSMNEETQHESQSVETQGAQSAVTHIDFPAGQLSVRGGAANLLDADFDYTSDEDKPSVEYSVAGGTGQLDITGHSPVVQFGRHDTNWTLRFGDTPQDLRVNMGAGHGDMDLRDVNLSRLEIHMGAGQLTVDLRGERKQNLDAEIHGGVGEATIRLPRDVGVDAEGGGGIGSIDTVGLRHEFGRYVNDAYGKSPVTIHLEVHGGIGQIRLVEEQ
jgi:hypothetical protein